MADTATSTPAQASETTDDLCRALHVTPQTIRLMVRRGSIPAGVRIGRRNLWPAGTAAQLLANARLEGGAA